MSTPAPASLHLPAPRAKRLPGKPTAARDATVLEAPAHEATLTVELCLRLTVSGVRGVMGVRDDAVAQYLAMLTQSAMEAARGERLRAPTLPAPAPDCIDAALVDECEQHDPHCTDPCCAPDDSDVFCADEGHVVLSQSGAYYGVSQW